MKPATITPHRIEVSALVFGILSSVAINAPDHAPVPGSGIATKGTDPAVHTG